MQCHVIIVAGGIGVRCSKDYPKQFLEIQGKSILWHSINAFCKSKFVHDMVVVANSNWMQRTRKICDEFSGFPIKVVSGGEVRQLSSYNGLLALNSGNQDQVLIHDAARPLVSQDLIYRVIQASITCGASIPAVDVKDSIIMTENNLVVDYPDRQRIKCVQTPQGFIYEVIRNAHEEAIKQDYLSATDDASLAVRSGYPVAVVQGDPENLKVTSPEDVLTASELIKRSKQFQ